MNSVSHLRASHLLCQRRRYPPVRELSTNFVLIEVIFEDEVLAKAILFRLRKRSHRVPA